MLFNKRLAEIGLAKGKGGISSKQFKRKNISIAF